MKFIFAILLLTVFSMGASAAYNKSGYQGRTISAAATLLASTEKTAAIDLSGFTLVGIKLPATFTGTAITFEASDAIDGTFVAVKSTTSGTALSYTVAQNTWVALDPKDFYGLNFIKIVSGSDEAANRALVLSLKGL
jgi:hypothetical protein